MKSDLTEIIRYSQVPGPFGFRVQTLLGDTTEVRVSPLLAASPHVLYTNVVEPLLRWMFVRKGYALVHGACIEVGKRAILVSARTDTGKTTTVLRTLGKSQAVFLSDDMTILSRDGRVWSYPKPLTISLHTLGAVNGAMLPFWQRIALRVQSRVHSRSGRRLALALAKTRLPMAWVNALAQILIPPPKFTIDKLIQGVKVGKGAQLVRLVFIERGADAEEPLPSDRALEVLLRNCEDAYGFPPYAELAEALLGSYDQDLREAESNIIADAISGCPASVIRRQHRNWWEWLVPWCDGLMNDDGHK